MADRSASPQLVVVGAGVFGLAIALRLQRAGRLVTLWDASAGAPNASSVAAGMLGPQSEVLFDPAAAPHSDLLHAAYAAWASFAALTPAIELDRSGAFLIEDRHPPRLVAEARVVDPPAALRAMREIFTQNGGVVRNQPFDGDLPAEAITILAPGSGAPGLTALAPELACLSPVKGQIARLAGGPAQGPVVRWPGGYLVPSSGGALVGATMEPGRADLSIDSSLLDPLIAAAAVHAPGIGALAYTGAAGIRMETPDGAPLVGPSRTPGVLLAVGARRNGWLLAPLVSALIAAYVTGKAPWKWACALHPGRFDG